MNFERKISLILIIVLIAAVVATIYIIISPNTGEKFTEFYILGSNGKAGDYPTNLTSGQTGMLTVGIVNREQETTTYKLLIKLNNNTLENQNLTLQNNEKKEIPFSFVASPGTNQKLEFLLYKSPDLSNVYRSLYLNVDVN